jgi:hypothetical protein
VTGVVTAADTGRPVDAATLLLTLDGSRPRSVVTDADGAFTFTDLPAGRYHLAAEKAGYLKVELGQHEPGSGRSGTPFQIVDGQRLTNVSLSLPRGGGITGLVIDDRGDPVSGLRVTARTTTLRRPDTDEPSAPPLFGSTDVSVAGASIPDVVVSMREGVAVSGRLNFDGDAGGIDRARVRVRLATGEAGPTPSIARIDDGGAFEIAGVPPGNWRFDVTGLPAGWQLASARLDDRETLDADVEIDGSRDRTGAELTATERATEIAGTVQDAAGQPTSRYTVIFAAEPRYWTSGTRRVQAVRGLPGRLLHGPRTALREVSHRRGLRPRARPLVRSGLPAPARGRLDRGRGR